MDISFSHHMLDGCIIELNTKLTQDDKHNEGAFTIILKSKINNVNI